MILEGLSHVAILALAQYTVASHRWIGTKRGPVRFDGLEWTTPDSLADLRTFDTWAFDTHEPHAPGWAPAAPVSGSWSQSRRRIGGRPP